MNNKLDKNQKLRCILKKNVSFYLPAEPARLPATTRENSSTNVEQAALWKSFQHRQNSPGSVDRDITPALTHLPTSTSPENDNLFSLQSRQYNARVKIWLDLYNLHPHTHSLENRPRHSTRKYIVRTLVYAYEYNSTEVVRVSELFKIFQPQAPLLKCSRRNCSTGSLASVTPDVPPAWHIAPKLGQTCWVLNLCLA